MGNNRSNPPKKGAQKSTTNSQRGKMVTDWAGRITACWRQSLDAIIEAGRLITEAKAALAPGAFTAMIEKDLPFGPRTAQRLMAIAADSRLIDPTHVSLLPPSWGTLYELTKLDDDEFDCRIADGTIKPEMQRRDIATVVKKANRIKREADLGAKQLALPNKKFGVVLEDYEWDYQTWSEAGKDRHASNHYPTSSESHTAEEIVERTKDRFKCAADDCVLWMWTPVPHEAIAHEVMRLRGFTYKSQVMWDKEIPGTGHWSQNQHEILLIGTRGNIPAPAPGTQWPSVIRERKRDHSRKPEKSYQMIEAYFPNIPKIELNCRGPAREGWDAWGNEAVQS